MAEEAIKKSGMELFRELLRLYPVAEVEDYYKAGQWKDDLMRTDLQLIEAHRKEAGAPDPLPLEEVPAPELPKLTTFPAGIIGVKPVLPALAAAGGLRPAVAPGAATTSVGGAAAVAGGPVAELRLIALFVAKWKLDPTRTKVLLAKETPQRRRYVIQNFKTTATGVEATEALSAYMEQCKKTNAWGAATAPAAATTPSAVVARPVTPRPAGVTAPAAVPAVAGIKRPLSIISPTVTLDPSKRPRVGPMGALTSGALNPAAAVLAARPRVGPVGALTPGAQNPAAAALAARLAAARARAVTPATVRPVTTAVQRAVPTVAGRPIAPLTTARPVTTASTIRPVAPKAKAAEKPGELIRNLLQRF